MTTDLSSATHRNCASDELLVAALTSGISAAEQRWLDTHLDACDRCLDAISSAMRRLHLADEIPAAVPAALRQRAAAGAALEPAAAILPGPRPANLPAFEQPTAAATRDWRTTGNSHERLPTFDVRLLAGRVLSGVQRVFRQPVMIPAALATAVVLVVAAQTWMTSGMPRPLTRSIAVPQHVRVTAVEAAVRRQPSGHAEIVATVTRGTQVEISGEERDWSHVILPNGTEGWVDQGALR